MALPGSFDLWFRCDVWLYFPFSTFLQIRKGLTFVSINTFAYTFPEGKRSSFKSNLS